MSYTPYGDIAGDGVNTYGHDYYHHLTGVLMPSGWVTFAYVDQVAGYLAKQYTVKTKQMPPVGNRSAVFEAKDARVLLDAPHMRFDFDVIYETNAFHAAWAKAQAEKKKAKSASEGGRF